VSVKHEESEARTAASAPGSVPTRATGPGEASGQIIGNYKLLQEQGEGGMGTVWMAQHPEQWTRAKPAARIPQWRYFLSSFAMNPGKRSLARSRKVSKCSARTWYRTPSCGARRRRGEVEETWFARLADTTNTRTVPAAGGSRWQHEFACD